MPRTWQRIMHSTLYVHWFITPNFQIRFIQVLSFDVLWKKWYWIRSNATGICCRFLSYYEGYAAYVLLQIHTLSEILHTRTKIIIITVIAIFNPCLSNKNFLFQNYKPRNYCKNMAVKNISCFWKEDPIYPVK